MDTRLAREQVEQIIESAIEKGERLEFSKADLIKVDLSGLDFTGANLRMADLRGANLRESNLSRSSLILANLRGANLIQTNLSGAVLRQTDLTWSNLVYANLKMASFTEADLMGANLSITNLSGANLRGANLQIVNFYGADLTGANLSEADLTGANLRGANLNYANLSGADLRQANIIRTSLNGTNLSETQVADTTFGDVELQYVEGLGIVRHLGPSIIGVDVLRLMGNKTPEIRQFFINAGIPIEFLECLEEVENPVSSLYTKDQINGWLDSLRKRMTIVMKNISILEEKKALAGSLDVPLKILNELDEHKEEKKKLEAQISKFLELKNSQSSR